MRIRSCTTRLQPSGCMGCAAALEELSELGVGQGALAPHLRGRSGFWTMRRAVLGCLSIFGRISSSCSSRRVNCIARLRYTSSADPRCARGSPARAPSASPGEDPCPGRAQPACAAASRALAGVRGPTSPSRICAARRPGRDSGRRRPPCPSPSSARAGRGIASPRSSPGFMSAIIQAVSASASAV